MAKKKKAQTYIVETPVKNYCGVGAGGVQFAYGKAEVQSGWVLNWYIEKGYKVKPKVDPEEDKNNTSEETDKD